MDCEDPYLAEEFPHNCWLCFDIVFAQLGVIPRRTNKSFEIVGLAERYIIIIHVKNKEFKKQLFQIYLPVKLADGRMSIKRKTILGT